MFNTGLSGSQARPKGAFISQDFPDPQRTVHSPGERNHQSSSSRGIWNSFKIKNPYARNQSQKIFIPVQVPIQGKTFLTCFSRSWEVRIYLSTNETPRLSSSLPKCSPKTQAHLLTFLVYIRTTSYHGAPGSQWYCDPHCLSNTPYLGQTLILCMCSSPFSQQHLSVPEIIIISPALFLKPYDLPHEVQLIGLECTTWQWNMGILFCLCWILELGIESRFKVEADITIGAWK